MRRTTCRACESKNLKEILNLGEMALAGGFLEDEKAIREEQKFPLPVHVCLDCSLVQILEVIDPAILFRDYSFSSSTIPPLVKHFEGYAQWLASRLSPKLVYEFGCNDGVLLAPLEKLGISAKGVDISENITEMARAKGLDVVTGFFDDATARSLVEKYGPADVVTGSNAFAHNDHPERVLEAARIALKDSGHLCLEVMYAGDLLELLQWDTLYHEHLTFYSLKTLEVLLKRYGFHLVHAERIPMHGGSLRVIAAVKEGEARSPELEEVARYEEKTRLGDPQTWIDFGAHIGRKIDVVRQTLGRLSKNSRIWGYGAAGKATMWVNACDMTYLEAMVDASPLRAGKKMPGTHTPIVFPAELRKNPPDYIFITAWNYADVIRQNESWFDGIWVTPLPDLRMF
ncbi:MAG TPA: class I SAM-dependent methyltransferase [Chthoniobacterales bacterium]|nr:class I SAM-dependent methyltransferase [Chthoniobacterales bacterium]